MRTAASPVAKTPVLGLLMWSATTDAPTVIEIIIPCRFVDISCTFFNIALKYQTQRIIFCIQLETVCTSSFERIFCYTYLRNSPEIMKYFTVTI